MDAYHFLMLLDITILIKLKMCTQAVTIIYNIYGVSEWGNVFELLSLFI